jgi:hypothetical protein
MFSPTKGTFNLLVVLQSHRRGDRPTGRHLFDGVISSFGSHTGLNSVFVELARGQDFPQFVAWLVGECNKGAEPLVHVDIHGDEKLGLEVGADYIDWVLFIGGLREINSACANRLFVVMAVCRGVHAIESPVRSGRLSFVENTVPFFAFIAVYETLYESDLDLIFPLFYERLLDGDFGGSLSAFSERPDPNGHGRPAPKPVLILPELIIYNALVDHFTTNLSNSRRAHRLEMLISKARLRPDLRTLSLRRLRKIAKVEMRPNAVTLNNVKRTALMADDPRNVGRFTFSFDDVMADARRRVHRSRSPES